MYADKDTLARHNGEALLAQDGMAAVESLLDAHIGYDEAGKLHTDEISDLTAQIAELNARRQSLIDERTTRVGALGRARHTGVGGIREATRTDRRGNNPIYAAVLRASFGDGQGGLWYPNALAHADENGRAFVELDEHLRAANTGQPAMLVHKESGNWTNVYISQTLRRRGLKPTTITVKEDYGHEEISRSRDAMELPVRKNRIRAFQLNPASALRGKDLADFAYSPRPEYARIRDAFTILLPQRTFDKSDVLGEYDDGDEAKELPANGKLPWMEDELGRGGRLRLAIGAVSVGHALELLRQDFLEKSKDPTSTEQILQQLGDLALGKKQPQRA
jgi:hypothetical protein